MGNNVHIDGNGNIVIQEADGAIITINPDNSAEVRQLIINLGNQISKLPQEVLEMINEKQDLDSPIKKGANVYLTVLVEAAPYRVRGFRFGITVTNLTEGYRYFNQPTFKVKPPFQIKEGFEHDSFVMITDQNDPFPCRLEYGQPVSVSYPIKPGVIPMYEAILAKDKDAYLQCFISTTVGELFESEPYKVSRLLADLEFGRR